MALFGCSDAMFDAQEGEEHLVLSQEIVTTHQFSKGAVNMEVTATLLDGNGNLYVSGTLGQGKTLNLGCDGPLSNPQGSLTDSFLVKYNDAGVCQWQRSWGSDDTHPYYLQTALGGSDLALTPSDTVVMLDKQYFSFGIYSGPSAKSAIVREVDDSGSVVWSDALVAIQGKSIDPVAVGVDDNNRITITGAHDVSFKFGSSNVINATSDAEVFVLSWDGTRARSWSRSFGGMGRNVPADLDVHRASGDIAIAGNYSDAHSDVNGTAAPASTTSSTDVFIQVLQSNGAHKASKHSEGGGSINHTGSDFKSVSAIAFSPGQFSKLYVIGTYRGEFQAGGTSNSLVQDNGFLDENTDHLSGNDADTDWFMVGYYDAAMTATERWATSRLTDLIDGGTDIAVEVNGFPSVVAFSGYTRDGVCGSNPDGSGCTPSYTGFAEYLNGNQQIPSAFNFYSQRYIGQSSRANKVDLDNSSSRLIVSGELDKANKNLGGGALPGSSDFVVSYSF